MNKKKKANFSPVNLILTNFPGICNKQHFGVFFYELLLIRNTATLEIPPLQQKKKKAVFKDIISLNLFKRAAL